MYVHLHDIGLAFILDLLCILVFFMTGLLDHFEGFMLDVAAIVDDKYNNDAADVCHNYQLPLARWDDKDREVSQIEQICVLLFSFNP